MDIAKNFAKVTVTDGNYDASSTSIDLITGHGARLPAAPFNAVWWNATDYPDPSDDLLVEIVRVTNVTGDTLTITRAQEGTAANDKNIAGKTYKMIAGLTARTITDMIGDVFALTGSYIDVSPPTDSIDVNAITVQVGDVEGAGVGTKIAVRNNDNLIAFTGQLGTDQVVSATTSVGTLVGKLQIFDLNGDSVGFIPIYATIT